MQAARPGRPVAHHDTVVSRTVLSVVRILIASYFLATASGLILEPSSRIFLDAVLDQQNARIVTTIYLFSTAFLVMVGMAVRPASLLLAVYIFWSGFLNHNLGAGPEALNAFWRDMALLGAVLLIAVTEPGGSAKFRLFRRTVAPRRVVPAMPRTGDAAPRSALRPQPLAAQSTRAASPAGKVMLPEPDDQDDDDGLSNIFTDIWDRPRSEEDSDAPGNVFA